MSSPRTRTAVLALSAILLAGCGKSPVPPSSQATQQPPPAPPAQQAASQTVDDMEREAARKYPNMTRSEAIKAVAAERAASQLGSAGSAEDKSKVAAHMFFGFYFTNVKGRAEYCTQHGTDITPFITAFTQGHAKEYERASAIVVAEGMNPEAIWPQMRAQVMPLVEQDMKDIATNAHAPLDASCKLFNDNAQMITERLKMPPDAENALMQGP